MKKVSSGITVQTPDPFDAKTYPVEITAITPNGYNSVTSTVSVKFNIDVRCEAKKITAGKASTHRYTIGSY